MSQTQDNIERLKQVYAKVKNNSDNEELNFDDQESDVSCRDQEWLYNENTNI